MADGSLLGDLWRWAFAVIVFWVFWVGVIFGAGLLVIEKFTKRPIDARPSLWLFGLCLLISVFAAWRNEHDAMVVYQQPIGKLIQAYVKAAPQINGFEVFAATGVQNPGTPTMVHAFAASVVIAGQRVDGQLEDISRNITVALCGYSWLYRPGDSLEDRGVNAIATGGSIAGILLFQFPNQSASNANFSTMKMTFKDVHDHVYDVIMRPAYIFVLPSNHPPPEAGMVGRMLNPYGRPSRANCANV